MKTTNNNNRNIETKLKNEISTNRIIKQIRKTKNKRIARNSEYN